MRAGIMCKHNKDAVTWLSENGHKMSLRNYQRYQQRIKEKAPKRLFELAKAAKEDQMELIDEFNVIKDELWIIYKDSTDDTIKIRTLRQIVEIIPFITSARAAIPYIIKEVIENFGKGESGDSKKPIHKESTRLTTS